ncbi:hypothetical protein SPONN_270 [uncultured Candidatus Thioglobus sp.]|nr:hypothetical protein SPONN_270 [uncultured Candidatus Thioglobus sp.]
MPNEAGHRRKTAFMWYSPQNPAGFLHGAIYPVLFCPT